MESDAENVGRDQEQRLVGRRHVGIPTSPATLAGTQRSLVRLHMLALALLAANR